MARAAQALLDKKRVRGGARSLNRARLGAISRESREIGLGSIRPCPARSRREEGGGGHAVGPLRQRKGKRGPGVSDSEREREREVSARGGGGIGPRPRPRREEAPRGWPRPAWLGRQGDRGFPLFFFFFFSLLLCFPKLFQNGF